MATPSPIAFVLVKFKGSKKLPMTVPEARRMFTAQGRGTLSVVDWFDDNTHGNVDMSGNEVFGWFDLPDTVADYAAKRASGAYDRLSIIGLGRAAAAAKGVNLAAFNVHVIVTDVEVDLFGGTGFVCCTAATRNKQFWEIQAAPSVLCQEIIHGLGAYEHTRRDGSDADYQDPYDVMSMFNASPGHHPKNSMVPVGPGLNAAYMDRCSWLDSSRLAPAGKQVVLRPLHRRQLAGALYARVGDYYVEYRPALRWDSGLPGSLVLVHRRANNTSYLVTELHEKESYSWNSSSPLLGRGSIHVDRIDDAAEVANLTVEYEPPIHRFDAESLISLTRGEWVDAGGIAIVGGRVVRIPPRSPELALLEACASLASLPECRIPLVAESQARAAIYGEVAELCAEERHGLVEPSSPFDHLDMEAVGRLHRKRIARSRKK